MKSPKHPLLKWFTPKAAASPASAQEPNPYLNARQHWNSHLDQAVSSAHVSRVREICAWIIVVACVAWIMQTGSKPHYIPMMVEVDRLGEFASSGPLQRPKDASEMEVRASLAHFVHDLRTVTPDITLENQGIWNVNSFLRNGDPAFEAAFSYLKGGRKGEPETNPKTRAGSVMVEVHVKSVLRLSPPSTLNNAGTWTVYWEEKTIDRLNGSMISNDNWQGTLETYLEPPPDDSRLEEIQRNPFGIKVRAFSFQKQS